MLKIGPFSKLAQVPVSLLRYYADIGLLEPAHIDRFTGYRYYDVGQLPRLNRILALRDLGLSLDQIKSMLSDGVSADEIRAMLRLQRAKAEQEVAEAEARLRQVAARLNQIEREGIMTTYDVVTKSVPAVTIAGIRATVPTLARMSEHYQAVFPALGGWIGINQVQIVGPPFAMFYQDEFTDTDIDVEIAFPVAPGTKEGEFEAQGYTVTVRTLPAEQTVVSTLHQGSYDSMTEAYQAVLGWAAENNKHVRIPSREIYLSMAEDDKQALTEVQYAVD
ncbi:MAG: MerR family transcriptional regulator [Chloroflexi bacterium]|nr:MerR family transcriptional regulator [Chloroflexota bacterium]